MELQYIDHVHEHASSDVLGVYAFSSGKHGLQYTLHSMRKHLRRMCDLTIGHGRKEKSRIPGFIILHLANPSLPLLLSFLSWYNPRFRNGGLQLEAEIHFTPPSAASSA